MSPAVTVNSVRNVARWSALVGGHAYDLIAQAKAESVKMSTPTGDVVTDPESPNFDLEKVLIHMSETV
ncbi:hypothetical protein BGZ74_005368 [Mortierella antarctica]|nr:hypothetical protein BGZ74_005368 [Mortierella antarctica]